MIAGLRRMLSRVSVLMETSASANTEKSESHAVDQQIKTVLSGTTASIDRAEQKVNQRPSVPSDALVFMRHDRLLAGQGTVVRTMPDDVKGVFAKLSDEVLLAVAQSMVELSPLAPVPHWHFGDFIQSPDIKVHVRHALWQAARERGLQGTICAPWHGGTKLEVRLGHDLSLGLLADGRLEPNEFALLDRVLQPGMVFLDAGANEGIYTLFASAKVGPKGRVIAVEPSPRELAQLHANLRLNETKNVEVVEQALAERIGTLRLRLAEERHSGQNTLGEFAYPDVIAAGEIQVAATTIDQMIRELELKMLDVIKLDLEGAEIRALAGASRSLEKFKPLVLVEALDSALRKQQGSTADLLALLESASYEIFAIDDETGRPLPYRQQGMKLSSNIVATHRARGWVF